MRNASRPIYSLRFIVILSVLVLTLACARSIRVARAQERGDAPKPLPDAVQEAQTPRRGQRRPMRDRFHRVGPQ